jgi:hypothetical protein
MLLCCLKCLNMNMDEEVSTVERQMREEVVEGYGIRIKEVVFLEKLIECDGKVIPAYEKAFGEEAEGMSNLMKKRAAYQIMNRVEVRKKMERMFKVKDISAEGVLGGIQKIAEGEMTRDGDKLKAWELLGKFLKLFGKGEERRETINLNIDEGTAVRLLERRSRYETGGRGDFIDVRGGGGESGDSDGEEDAS